MIYQSKTIKEITDEMNVKYFLPHIQRELVWQPKQIGKLFDSFMRGYPINTFLFWRLVNKKDITKLKFIDNYEKGKKNEIHTNTDRDEYWLVLDGQQRLQSFFIALRGTYNGKELFLNVLSEKSTDQDVDDEENDIIYETNFFKNSADYFFKTETDGEDKSKKKMWVKVKNFALLDEDKLFNFVEHLKEDKLVGQLSILEGKLLDRNVKKLNTLVTSTETIFYYLENEEDYDKVLDIFIRTNSGGTKLSKSDLLFSMVKLHWKNLDAYQLFNQLESDLNNRGDFDFDKDFILKTALVLIGADPRYRIENFSRANISTIESQWKDIEGSIRITLDLLLSLGINSKKILTSKNSIIPVVYYTYHNKIRTYQSDGSAIVQTKQLIKKWLLNVLLVKLYSSQTDDMLKRARDVIDKSTLGVFPEAKLINNLPPGKSTTLRLEDFNEIDYGDSRTSLVLALLYPEFNFNTSSSTNKANIDHIFPRSLSEKGLDIEILDNIGNLEFLTDTENKSKNDSTFEEWLKSQDHSFLERNLIPSDSALYAEDRYKDFILTRRNLIFKKILDKLSAE